MLSSIKIMKKLIDNYPVSSFLSEKYTKSSIIDHLINDKGLVNILIKLPSPAECTTDTFSVLWSKDILEVRSGRAEFDGSDVEAETNRPAEYLIAAE